MLAYLFVLLAVAVRFLVVLVAPHPWAFTPVGASLLFFGAHQPKRRIWIPVLLFAGTDFILSRFVWHFPLSADLLVTFAWYAGIAWLGSLLKYRVNPLRVLSASLATALSFFVISNFATWLVWNLYPHTFAGLMTCYTLAIPFFRNELVSDVLFSAVFFSIPAVIHSLSAGRERVTAS